MSNDSAQNGDLLQQDADRLAFMFTGLGKMFRSLGGDFLFGECRCDGHCAATGDVVAGYV